MRKTTSYFLCVFTLFLCSTINVYSENLRDNTISNQSSSSINSQSSAIQPLTVTRFVANLQTVDSVVPDCWWNCSIPELVCIPTAGRTSATTAPDDYNYIYWAKCGLSRAMPYALGLYAIALEINPALTKNDLRKMIVDTAYVNFEQLPIRRCENNKI